MDRDGVDFVSADSRLAERTGELFADRLAVRVPVEAHSGTGRSHDERRLLVGVVSAASRLSSAERLAAEVAEDDGAQMIVIYE
jgi:hypothetical protein